MRKQIMIVGAAVGVALMLLGVTLILSPSGTVDENGPPEAINPDDLPADTDLGDGTSAGGTLPAHGSAGRGQVTRVDEDRITRLTWRTIEPAEDGVYDVGAPTATVEFSPSRVLSITAREATLIAPEGTFRRGEFRGDVVVTFFDAGDARADLTATRHIQTRVYLDDDAAFDLELGQISSTGPLHLTSRVADFQGRGLSLKYNRVRERIERLIVEEGRELRFAANGDGLSDRNAEAAEGADSQPQPQPPTATAGQADQPSRDEGDSDPKTTNRITDPPQFYRARFQRDVHVTAGGDDPDEQADLRGGELVAVFALDSRSDASDDERDERDEDASSHTDSDDTPGADTADEAPRDQPTLPDRSLLPRRKDNVIVRWSGPLVLMPLGADEQAIDADDLRLDLRGDEQTPATVRTARGDAITAESVGYRQIGARVLAAGSDRHPMRLTSDELGTLTGTRLQLSQETGEGFVLGPGTLTARADDDDQPTDQTADDAPPAPPSSIAWSDRMDMRFFVDEQADDARRLAALEHVTFRGEVMTEHEDDRLASDRVDIAFARDEDDPRRSSPRLLMARGEVSARQPGMTFAAERLDATITPRNDADADGTAEASADDTPRNSLAGRLDISRIVAVDEIRVTIDAQDATITAARLEATPAEQTVELTGTADAPAVLARPDGRLTGERIVLDQPTQRVTVTGAGKFTHQLDPDDAQAVLAVAWRERMVFDNAAGTADFTGSVRATSSDGPDTSELTSRELALRFDPEPMGEDADDAPADAHAADGAGDAGPARGIGRVRGMEATGDVAFSATARNPEAPAGPPRSRLLIEGPVLTFENTPASDESGAIEQVNVVGAGRMLVEHYQADAPADGEEAAAAGDDEREGERKPVNFAGQGATLFIWQGRLTLDAANNDMVIVDGVQMIHRPRGEPEEGVVQLNCQRLLADLTQTGGLTAWSSRGTPDATLRLVEATGAVRLIQQGRQISSDHLRYTSEDQTVVLWTNEGEVSLIDEEGGSSMTAAALKWNLAEDRFEAMQMRGGIAPIRRD